MSVPLFDQIPIFEDMVATEMAIIQQLFIPVKLPAGSQIFNQGDEAVYLYIVVSGEVSIQFKPYDGPLLTIAQVKENGVVGWSAALGSETYTSSAICTEDCQLLRVRGEDLGQLCQKHPQIGNRLVERLADVIAQRMRNTHGQVIAMLENGLRINLHKDNNAENFAL